MRFDEYKTIDIVKLNNWQTKGKTHEFHPKKMGFTVNQIAEACGILLLNESHVFVYYCKECKREFECGPDLEVHILTEHDDSKANTEDVFVCDGIFVDTLDDGIEEEQTPNECSYECDEAKAKYGLEIESISKSESEFGFEEVTDTGENEPEASFNEDDEYLDVFYLDTDIDEDQYDDDDDCDELFKPTAEDFLDEMEDDAIETITTQSQQASKRSNNNTFDVHIKTDLNEYAEQPEESQESPRQKQRKQITQSKMPTDNKSKSSKLYYCDMCPTKTFTCKMNVRQHVDRRHNPKTMQKVCPICKITPRKYETHMRTKHLEERPYKCDMCAASFKINTDRVIHMRTHTGERPFLCIICGASYKCQAARRKHEITSHEKRKQHQCDQCERSFYSPYQLKDHINSVHLKLRPHICTICNKDFSSRQYFYIHKKIHRDGTFQCRYCEKVFKLWENRHKHERLVHAAI